MFEKYFNEYNYFHLLDKGENYIDEYIINVNYDIGIRLKKEQVLKGIMVYKILKDVNMLEIIYYDEYNNSFNFGQYEINYYKKI